MTITTLILTIIIIRLLVLMKKIKNNEESSENKPETTNVSNVAESSTVAKPVITLANAEATKIDTETTTTTEEDSSSDKYEKPIIKGRNDTEHPNNYFIEQFNRYKEEFSRKKLEEKKAQEAQKTAEASKNAEAVETPVEAVETTTTPEVVETAETIKTPVEAVETTTTPEVVETAETTKTPEVVKTAEAHKTSETVEAQPKQTNNTREVKDEKPTPLSPGRAIFNSVKNSLLDGITSFATSSRFVDDGFLGVPMERDPTSETTESTENSTTKNDTSVEEGPMIQMKQVTLSEYEKTDNTNNDVSVDTKEVEEFSNGIINYNDLDYVEKQHPSIVKAPVKTSANRIIDEEMSVPVSEDSFDYNSYSPSRPEDNTNLNVEANEIKNERTEDELELLRAQMSYEGDIFPNSRKREVLNKNDNVATAGEAPPTPDSTHEPDYYLKKGKQIYEEEYKKGKNENSEELDDLMDVEFINIEDINDIEESTYDNKVQGKPVSASKKAQKAQRQFETFEFDIYDDPEIEKRIKQKKQETDLLDEYEII